MSCSFQDKKVLQKQTSGGGYIKGKKLRALLRHGQKLAAET